MIKVIELWLIIFISINLFLLLIGFLIFIPRKIYKENIFNYYRILKHHIPYLFIIFGTVFFHLFEVNIIDPVITEWIGYDFANNIQYFENNISSIFYNYWSPITLYFFVIMYIVVYPFTLWFSPLYFIINDEKNSMKTLAYGLLIIYLIALPFYLFIPITNVYTFNNLESSLNNVLPGIENFFYITTTRNNCLPSLHVAMSILICRSVYLTRNKKFFYFSFISMISVIFSVIYLAIHWITDVICGALLSIAIIFLLNYFIKEE